jgi:gliding motility-associated-like protein
MKYKLLFIILFFSVTIKAQYTSIPDINFEKALISLGIDNGVPDGKVLTSSISNISTLSIGARNISDLTGIADFINLTELQCQANKLTTLELSNNLKLEHLDCETNQLKALDLSNNLQLEYFDCHNNQLTTLDLSNNLQLVILECDSNQLTTLDLSNNLKLEDIDCHSNQLTNLNITKNLKLKIIESQENKLTFLDLSSKINLTFLDLDNNYITNIDVSENIGLQGLQVNFNLLKSLDVSKNINLLNLQCVENQLKALDLSKNPDLYLLYCRNNQLSSLDVSKNPKIRYVSCYNNNLTSLNLKNGKNTIFNIDFWYYVNFKFNPDLKCILVDNSAYSNTNWSDLKDATASYSDNLDIGPSSITPQTFCIQQNATLSSITITGQNIKWYDALTNGNLLANTTLLQNNTTYFASQTINGCESERAAILINIQNTPLPTADTNQTFCSDSNSTIAAIKVTGNQIKWYDALTNGLLLAETMNLADGQTYYASQTVNNCESERFSVNVSIVNKPAAPIANATESFCKKENATLNSIQISGQNIKWYDTNSAVATLPNTTLLENNKTYYVSQTIGCESTRTAILIQVYDTPLPTGNTNQQFCVDENATLSNFNMVGSNIKWYDESTNGTVLAATTLLQNGKTYYATQTLNDCESERVAVFVKIQDTPIPIANSPQTFCVQKNAKISDIVIEGQNITWFENASSTLNLSESTLLENGITYYASQTINNCESDRILISITILEATSEDCINFVDELPYPKFFTPNNDGYNDTWTIDFAYLAPNTGIKIFDRYGKLIKTLVTNNDSWNGTFNGTELPSTDYWFVVTRANGQEYKGHFSLKR